MSFGSRQLPSNLAAIALGCLLTVISAAPPPTPDDGYRFGFRYGAITGFAVACLTAAVALWVSPHMRRLRRQVPRVHQLRSSPPLWRRWRQRKAS